MCYVVYQACCYAFDCAVNSSLIEHVQIIVKGIKYGLSSGYGYLVHAHTPQKG